MKHKAAGLIIHNTSNLRPNFVAQICKWKKMCGVSMESIMVPGHDKKCLILDPDPYSYLNIIKLNCQIFTPKIGPQYKYYITECRVMHCTVP